AAPRSNPPLLGSGIRNSTVSRRRQRLEVGGRILLPPALSRGRSGGLRRTEDQQGGRTVASRGQCCQPGVRGGIRPVGPCHRLSYSLASPRLAIPVDRTADLR